MTPRSMTLLQGTLDVLVLRALEAEARHGYGVAEWIRSRSGDALEVEDGALYTALHRMAQRGWLEASWGLSENNRKAKYYALTDEGRKALARATAEWSAYAEVMARVLGTG